MSRRDWRPEFTAGQLVKMGKFKDAIPIFSKECKLALRHNVVTPSELFSEGGLVYEFQEILLNPSDFDKVQLLGDKMMRLAVRIPGYLPIISKEEFYKNIKLNYETITIND